jgi:Kef-type K+ transport system membrane component KefB/nucleotide-binding universal stress UspA family protein
MTAALIPLPGHAVFLLLIQLALLLVAARLGAELIKRIALPAVIGELAAGIVLGPSVFGHYAPGLFLRVFPQESAQFHLLESVGTLGMVLLLLLTGLETDLRLLKNLGKAAFVASIMGMLIPFGLGFGLGSVMPDIYLAQPNHRVLFSLFLATAMSISAMPVIAKILMDLDLTKRNIGLVILSAGVVDDTAGWLILSVIAGAASQGSVHLLGLGRTVGLMLVFVAVCAFVLHPLLRALIRITPRLKAPHADLAVVVILSFRCAAATEDIGVHAVFGAFIIGTVFRQIPQLSHETVHGLETFVMTILAPIFFGVVGLKVNLWALAGGGGGMLGIVVAVACTGKLVGCTLGGLWGGLRFWEALSIAVAMNARGAMELVVATIGLSLGILNQATFSMIVVVAISTSFLAPVLLRLTMRMVRMTDEEAQRILAEQSMGAFDPSRIKLLVPTAGGPNALEAMRLAVQLGKKSDGPIEVLYIDSRAKWWERFVPFRRRDAADGRGIDGHLAQMKKLSETRPPHVRVVATHDVPGAILEEAKKGADLIMMGASQRGATIGGKVLQEVVEGTPCHVAIMRAHESLERYRSLFVLVEGGMASRVAVELSVRYAELSGAELTLAMLNEDSRGSLGAIKPAVVRPVQGNRLVSLTLPPPPVTPEQELERVSVVFRTTSVKPNVLKLDYDPNGHAVETALANNGYDLVVLGAENRAIQNRLFFGHEKEQLLERTTLAVLVVVPSIAMLK